MHTFCQVGGLHYHHRTGGQFPPEGHLSSQQMKSDGQIFILYLPKINDNMKQNTKTTSDCRESRSLNWSVSFSVRRNFFLTNLLLLLSLHDSYSANFEDRVGGAVMFVHMVVSPVLATKRGKYIRWNVEKGEYRV